MVFGESETYDGYQSDYWSLINTPARAGCVSNVFFIEPAKLPGVPSCI